MSDTAVYVNNRIDGGGEQSAKMIAKMLDCPTISLTTDAWKTTPPPKKQIWYCNDFIYKAEKEIDEFKRVIMASEKVYMVLNFTTGPIGKMAWLKDRVRRFFFLNHDKLNGFQATCAPELKEISKRAYPPPVDISQYLDIERPLGRAPIVIGRHSRMSLKYPVDPCSLYLKLIEKIPEAHYAFMIPHKKIEIQFQADHRFHFYRWNEMTVREFLASIDIYASIISPKCHDQGPRVLCEAMASGLPCVVEDRDGMKERMINGTTGYLIADEDEAVARICDLYNQPRLRLSMGQGARNRAKFFDPGLWIKDMED
jgi:hypothetical protein